MNASKENDLLKSLDRIIERMENRLKVSKRKAGLILSKPDETSLFSTLSLKGIK